MQSAAFDQARSQLYPDEGAPIRAFKNKSYISQLGAAVRGRRVASDNDLKYFQHRATKDFVAEIYSRLESAIRFENHSHSLAENADNVRDYHQQQQSLSNLPPTAKPAYADQLCVYKNELDRIKLLLIIEYKAPHKLKCEFLRAALGDMSEIDVENVRDESIISGDDREQYSQNSRRLVAAVATHVYHYMTESGCPYGCIVTGEAMVFLWIKEDEATTLYYHLAEPSLEVSTYDRDHFPHHKTAISQLLSFCLMARDSSLRSKEWRKDAIAAAPGWTVNYDKLFSKTPKKLRELQKKLDKQDLAFKGRKARINHRSPYRTRRLKQPKSYESYDTPKTLRDDRQDPSDGSGENSGKEEIPCKPPASKTRRGHQKSSKYSSTGGKQQQRLYCTQACILGLVLRHPIDDSCPNAASHRRSAKGNTHLLTKSKLCTLLRRQLAKTLDENCVDLRLSGARGMLFQLTLASDGYTFVGKGTTEIFVRYLRYERLIYRRLSKLQGSLIPVYLGNIDFDVPLCDLGICVVHVLLMSYGGERVEVTSKGQDQEVKQFEARIAEYGVVHRDIRCPNLLFNQELQRLMFIDFERSTVARKTKRKVLQELPANGKGDKAE